MSDFASYTFSWLAEAERKMSTTSAVNACPSAESKFASMKSGRGGGGKSKKNKRKRKNEETLTLAKQQKVIKVQTQVPLHDLVPLNVVALARRVVRGRDVVLEDLLEATRVLCQRFHEPLVAEHVAIVVDLAKPGGGGGGGGARMKDEGRGEKRKEERGRRKRRRRR